MERVTKHRLTAHGRWWIAPSSNMYTNKIQRKQAELFNTDQGSQFTSDAFTKSLKDADIRISMDGKGHWRDNIMIERLWHSLKYECIYLHAFETGREVKRWIEFYNTRRMHSKLDDRTPDEAYWRKPRPGYTGRFLQLVA
jgi:putative transposase